MEDEQAGKFQATATKSKSSLLDKTNKEFLQQTIISRDEANNGMTRNEIFAFIQMLVGCDQKSAENHYDYLTRNKKLPKLKRHGRTVIAQKTTTSRTQIRSEGQLRWHAVLDAVWDDLTKHNVLPPGDARKIFELVKEHFWLNLDETCIQCNDGNIRIVGSKERKTQSKITDDSRFSITILRVGNAAGLDGPIIIILKGKSNFPNSIKNYKNSEISIDLFEFFIL